jgi:hypothetical protein
MIPAAAPTTSPVSIFNPAAAAPLLVVAGAVLVDELELPPAAVEADGVEAGPVVVLVLVPVTLLAVEVADAAVLAPEEDAEDAEDVEEDAVDTALDELRVLEVLNRRLVS